jgi:prepilin-type N-terminal cleavage/methylation domain-containing protein
MRKTRQAFTLTELLIVIAIIAVLAAISFPVIAGFSRHQLRVTCVNNLRQLGMALRSYDLDWEGLPPVYVLDLGDDGGTPTDESWLADDEYLSAAAAPLAAPFKVLVEEGYLRSRDTLHCPLDEEFEDPRFDSYMESYSGTQGALLPADELVKITYQNANDATDPWNGLEVPLSRWRYMPARYVPHAWGSPAEEWGPSAAPPDTYTQRRMLAGNMSRLTIDGNNYWTPSFYGWAPADDAVVTFCDRHTTTHTIMGEGQYLVLFWDGSVHSRPAEIFVQGGAAAPPAAWEVTK